MIFAGSGFGWQGLFDKSGFGEVTESYVAVDDRYMQLPSFLRGPLALISTRSGTRLVRNLAKCRRSQMSPRETCQPHIAGLLAGDRQMHKTVRTLVAILQGILHIQSSDIQQYSTFEVV